MGPWNLLDLKTRICSRGRVPNHWGMYHLIYCFQNQELPSFYNLPKIAELPPPPPPSSNSLPFKLLLCSLLPFEHVFGMDSLRLFICRSNTESLLLSLIKNCGMMLLELLCDKSRTPRELKLQMDGGISPVNLLCEMKKINVLSGGTRSGQLSKLDRRST